MKILFAFIAFILLSVSYAYSVNSENVDDPMTVEKSRVEDFEDEILYTFQRFQRFYDGMNFQFRTYRLDHVALVSSIFNQMMTVFGNELDYVRRASVELDELIEARTNEIGETECIRNVMSERDRISTVVTSAVHACTLRANSTMRVLLRDVFYPTFANIQAQALSVNLLVMNALAIGDVVDGTDDILNFLNGQYELFSNQWPQGATQLMRWETERFRTEGEFYIDEMIDCMYQPVLDYIIRAASLEYQLSLC